MKVEKEWSADIFFENASLVADKFLPSQASNSTIRIQPVSGSELKPFLSVKSDSVIMFRNRATANKSLCFKDYIFVMEAPGGDAVSKQAIKQIKKTIPGKPIRYVAVTHHHDDHAGGLRTYIAEGATVIALPGEKSFLKKS